MLDHNFSKFIILMVSLYALMTFDVSHAKVEGNSVELKDGTVVTGVNFIEKNLSDSDLTFLGLTIGVSKLSDVKNKIGNGEIYHEGEAGTSLNVLCYESNDGSVIVFESSEMGGSDHVVTSTSLHSPKSSYRLKKICTKSSSIRSGVSLGDIQIAMSKAAVKKIKGQPSKELKKILLYEYRAEEKTTKGLANISSTLEIEFVANKVSKISISKIESY